MNAARRGLPQHLLYAVILCRPGSAGLTQIKGEIERAAGSATGYRSWYAAWQATQVCVTSLSAPIARPRSRLTAASCAATANRLAA